VEIARRFYPGTVDMVALLAGPAGYETTRAGFEPFVQPDFETVTVSGQVPLTGIGTRNTSRPTLYGLEGFFSGFREWLNAWETWEVTATEFIDVDADRVLVMIDVLARTKTHQVEMPIEGANLLTFRDGRLARLELFFDRAEALEAARLSE
jgi:ketosteroid isomerase-like protein